MTRFCLCSYAALGEVDSDGPTHTPASIVAAKLRAYENNESTRHLDDIGSIVCLQDKKRDRAEIDIVAAPARFVGSGAPFGKEISVRNGRIQTAFPLIPYDA